MNCDNCQTMRAIRTLLDRCHKCDECPSHHGASHVEATDFTLSHKRPDALTAADDADPTARFDFDEPTNDDGDGCTTMQAGDEDRWRKFAATLFGGDPFDVLLVHHLIGGGNLATFGAYLTGIVDRASKYHGNPRAMAHARKTSIVKRCSTLVPFFASVISGGAKARNARNGRSKRRNGR